MICDRFSVFLAVGVTCLGLASGDGSYLTYKGRNYNPMTSTAVAETIKTTSLNQSKQISRASQADNSISRSTLAADNLKYENYMQAGYQADRDKDYLTALQYFKTALAIRPQDSLAQKAVRNFTGYAFDSSMQAGYQADRQKDYQTALKYFRQAQEIRPDSFYAQQAIRNVSSYLAIENNNVETESNERQNKSNLGFWLMLIALFFAIGVAGGILFLLFKQSDASTSDSADDSSYTNAEDEVATVVAPAQTYPQVISPSSSAPDTTMVATTRHNDVKEEGQKTRILTSESNGNHLQSIEQPAVRESFFISSSPSQVSKLDIIPELIGNLQHSDRAFRRKTIWELAQRADSRAMKPLVELMMKVDSQERSLILEAMTQIASRTLKPMNKAVSLSLEDDNSQVRQNAIRDLTRVYELMSQVTQRLSEAVDDSDEEVQQTAKWALKQLNQMPKMKWQNTTDSSDAS